MPQAPRGAARTTCPSSLVKSSPNGLSRMPKTTSEGRQSRTPLEVFTSGLSIIGDNTQYRLLAVGVLVILAVSVDQWIRKVKS